MTPTTRQCSLAAAAITALLALQPTGILQSYDVARMHEPYRAFFVDAVRAGEFPWWNPYTALGRPFFADIETATLYPTTWLALLFGVGASIVATVAIHLALAIAGTARLAERLGTTPRTALLCGLSFALSGALLARMQAGQLQFFCVVCLWPWLWDAFLRVQDRPGLRSMLAAAGWLLAAILAGSPQILWCGLVLLFPALAVRSASWRELARTTAWTATAGVLALGLAAFQVLPFLELVAEGNRPLGDAHFAARNGQVGESWWTLLVPPGAWLPVNFEFNLHGGMLMIAGIAGAWMLRAERNARFLTALFVMSLLLAAGDSLPVLPALAEHVPGFASLRYPSRYGLVAVLALTVLGFRWLDRSSLTSHRQNALVAFHLFWLVAALFVQGALWLPKATPRYEAQIRADLTSSGVAGDPAPPRSLLPQSLLRPNAGAEAGVSTVSGFNNPALLSTWSSLYALAGTPAPDFHRTDVNDDIFAKLYPFRDFFSVAVAARPPTNEVEYRRPAPRVYLAHESEFAPLSEVYARVRAGHDYRRRPLIQARNLEIPPAEVPAAARVLITEFSLNTATVSYETSDVGLLVLAEPNYPSWRAEIDGAQAIVGTVNGWMRGVVVPPGNHSVKFTYQSTSAALGAAISVGSVLAFVVLLIVSRHRQRRAQLNASAQSGT